MQLYQLEEQLKRMREQGADDYTEVAIGPPQDPYYVFKFIKEVNIYIGGGCMSKRIINITD